jgi:hypothetical protein
MKKTRNMFSPMHPEAIRLKVISLDTKGNVLLLYGSSYISSPIFMGKVELTRLTTAWTWGKPPPSPLYVYYVAGHVTNT